MKTVLRSGDIDGEKKPSNLLNTYSMLTKIIGNN